MKLHSPQFEKSLRRRIKKTLRSSPELRREYRAAKKPRKHYSLTPVVSFLMAFLPGLLIWSIRDIASRPETALAIITLWGFSLIIIRAQSLLSCLFASKDLRAFVLLPIAEQTVFQWELQKFLRGSILSLFHFLGAFFVLAWLLEFSALKWLAVFPLALLTWAMTMATGTFCAARWPSFPYRLFFTGFFILFFAIIVGQSHVAQPLLTFVDYYASSINLFLPTGWPVSLFHLLLPNPRWLCLFLLIPIGALLLTWKKSLARLAIGYQYKERTIPPAPDIVPHSEAVQPAPQNFQREQPVRFGPTAIEEIIRSRQFLAAFPWHNAGWFESLLWGWLSEREKTLSEFVFPNGFAITGPWKTIFRNLAVAVLVALLIGLMSPVAKMWLLGIGFFVTICHALAQLLITGRAFQLVATSGVGIPMYAGFAIGLRELSRFLVKCSVIQLPLLFSFAIACGAVLISEMGVPLELGLWCGFKSTVLVLAARYVAITIGFSNGSNDTSKIRLRTASLILSMIVFVLAFVGLGAASLLVPDQRIALPLSLLTLVEAYATFRLYGWFYNANRFDIMRIPQR